MPRFILMIILSFSFFLLTCSAQEVAVQEQPTKKGIVANQIQNRLAIEKPLGSTEVKRISKTHQPIKAQEPKLLDSSEPSKMDENKKQIAKYIIITLLLISVVTVCLHLSGKLILYNDYTDAAMTIASILAPLAALLVCAFLDLSSDSSMMICFLLFLSIFIFVFKMTHIINNNVVFTVMALTTKYTTSLLYVALFLMFFCSGSARKPDESSVAFELRKQREQIQNKAWQVAITALFIAFVHNTTKIKTWSPLADYFALNFKRINESSN